jgi:hypothetical protein
VSALTSLLYFSLKYYFSLSFFTLFCKASLIGCCSTGGTSLRRPPVLAGGEESEWCLPAFLASCSAVVQWCSGARRHFWCFPTVRKKVVKEEKKHRRLRLQSSKKGERKRKRKKVERENRIV